MNDPRDNALKSVRAAVPARVQARIVSRAMARLDDDGRRARPWRAVTVGAIGLAVTAFVWNLLPFTEPERETAIAPALAVASTIHPRAEVLGPHRIELSQDASLTSTGGGSEDYELSLVGGSGRFTVDPLPKGRHFRVRTAQALVEVVGTLFTVAVDAECTRVEVEEGRVRVQAGDGSSVTLDPGNVRQVCHQPGEGLVREALTALQSAPAQSRTLLTRYLSEQPGGAFEEDVLFHLWRLEARGPGARPDEARALALRFVERFSSPHRVEAVRGWLKTEEINRSRSGQKRAVTSHKEASP